MTVLRLTGLVVALLSLVACGAFSKDEASDPPAELVEFDVAFGVDRVWSHQVGKGAEELRLGLVVAADSTRVYTASRDGTIRAFEAASGNKLWTLDTARQISAGPGIGESMLAVASADGDIIALETDGVQRWARSIGSEVLAPPAIADGVVTIRTGDGRLVGLDAIDGTELWAIEYEVPQLTLRGNAPPAAAGGIVISGFDNGKLIAARAEDGLLAWEAPLGVSRGRNVLERLIDLDARPVIDGNEVYVVGYQGRAAVLQIETGQPLWTRDLSSYAGGSVDYAKFYVSTANGEVVALDKLTGGSLWVQDSLRNRLLTTPVLYRNTVVVGDLEGYVHWLDRESGAISARARAAKSSITAQPVVAGDLVCVLDDGGTLSAFRAAGS